MEHLYSKQYSELSRKILTSKITKITWQKNPLKRLRLATITRALPDINFWYLFMYLNQAPSLAKKNITRKKSRRYFQKDVTIIVDLPVSQYSRVILKIFAFLTHFKDIADFKLNKFSNGGETILAIKNCAIDDDTNELGMRSNYFIDDIFLSLKIGLSNQLDYEYTYVVEMLHSLPTTLNH